MEHNMFTISGEASPSIKEQSSLKVLFTRLSISFFFSRSSKPRRIKSLFVSIDPCSLCWKSLQVSMILPLHMTTQFSAQGPWMISVKKLRIESARSTQWILTNLMTFAKVREDVQTKSIDFPDSCLLMIQSLRWFCIGILCPSQNS